MAAAAAAARRTTEDRECVTGEWGGVGWGGCVRFRDNREVISRDGRVPSRPRTTTTGSFRLTRTSALRCLGAAGDDGIGILPVDDDERTWRGGRRGSSTSQTAHTRKKLAPWSWDIFPIEGIAYSVPHPICSCLYIL